MKVILADSTFLETSHYLRKIGLGTSLTNLFIGNNANYGLIAEVNLNVMKLP